MRYWVYVHDRDGEMEEDFGEFPTFNDALLKVINFMDYGPFYNEQIIRIVDNNNEGQTCWIAGPNEYMKDFYNAAR